MSAVNRAAVGSVLRQYTDLFEQVPGRCRLCTCHRGQGDQVSVRYSWVTAGPVQKRLGADAANGGPRRCGFGQRSTSMRDHAHKAQAQIQVWPASNVVAVASGKNWRG